MMLVSTLNAELARLDGEIALLERDIIAALAQAEAVRAYSKICALKNQRRLLIDPEFFIPNDDP
jgi:outer membrane murein-binding lipoprotein Lpp